MLKSKLWISFFGLLTVVCYGEELQPKVQTPLGGIKGFYLTSAHGKKYEAYEGVPYAQPPVGQLRFEPPKRIEAWTGELSATKRGSPCLQYTHFPSNLPERVEGAEDCLYINIYAPLRENKTTLVPVLFWIHGGAFQYGSGSPHATYLIDRDVILVAVNYRLGPLGFLSTEDNVVPGNMGLKDQSMAIRWVSENIEHFGGDPKKITLGGLSAGGASVHYHYLSPLSAGLFQGGISASGTSLVCWAQAENSLDKAKKLGELMGCSTDKTDEMVDCLKTRPSRAIVEAVSRFMPWLYNPYSPFGPLPEKSGDSPFIDRTPIEIIRSGDVHDIPWVTGVVSEEGLYPSAEFVLDEKHMKELDENWRSIAPHLLDYNYTLPKEKHDEVSDLIRKHYLDTKPINRETEAPLTQMIGDRLFIVDSEKAAREQAKVNKNPVWYYYFTYRGAQSLTKLLSHNDENLGVSHGDDTCYVLDQYSTDTSTTPEDREMQKLMLDFWVSFMKDGTPSLGIEWPKLDPTKQELHYLHIAAPGNLSMVQNDNFGHKKFWQSIDFNENKVPV